MNALSVDQLVVSYGAVRAVAEVTFDVAPGEICALVGPNGSGKSSLLNAVSGFIPISKGAVLVGGTDVTSSRAHVVGRLGVGRTFQLVRLLNGLTVLDNVASGQFVATRKAGAAHALRSIFSPRKLQGDEREAVEHVLERLGIADRRDAMVDELPFGLQRRVEVARAIVSQPRLLLFDEPAAGLSDNDLDDLATVIRAEAERGCAVVLVDHHLHFVLDVCPRAVVLNFGTKIFDGPSQGAVEQQDVREAYVGV